MESRGCSRDSLLGESRLTLQRPDLGSGDLRLALSTTRTVTISECRLTPSPKPEATPIRAHRGNSAVAPTRPVPGRDPQCRYSQSRPRRHQSLIFKDWRQRLPFGHQVFEDETSFSSLSLLLAWPALIGALMNQSNSTNQFGDREADNFILHVHRLTNWKFAQARASQQARSIEGAPASDHSALGNRERGSFFSAETDANAERLASSRQW